MDRTNTFSPISLPSILILSARNEPPDIGDVGSRARTATLSPRSDQCFANLPIRVDFPEPGGPVTPRVQIDSEWSFCGSCDCSISVSSLDKLRRSPDFARSSSSSILLNSSSTPNRLRLRLEHCFVFFPWPHLRIREHLKWGFRDQKQPLLHICKEVLDPGRGLFLLRKL